MGIIRLPQNNFARGELDPEVAARNDAKLYREGLKKGKNISLKTTGGFRRRPGTRYLADLTALGTVFKQISFVASETYRYNFVFTNARVDIFDMDGANIANFTGCPWTTAMVPGLYWAQDLDTLIICHEDLDPQRIVRTGPTSFTRSAITWEQSADGTPASYAPIWKHAPLTMTVTPSAATGAITLTASANWWLAAHVGQTIWIKNKAVKITGLVSALVANATVINTLTDVLATTDWTEQAFSTIFGYPITCFFTGQRLCFAGHKAVPDALWFSAIKSPYKHFLNTSGDNDAIAIRLGTDQRNEIRAAVVGRHVQLFTSAGVFYGPTLDTKGLTPTNAEFRRQVPFGIARDMRPAEFDGASIFIQKEAPVVREFLYQYTEDAYTGEPVSLLSQHLISAPKRVISVFGGSDAPDNCVLILNGDGTLAQYQSVRSQQVAGWAPWETDGVIVDINAVESQLFAIVKRTANGGDVYYLEKFDWDSDISLDCCKQGSGAAATVWSNATHLRSRTVKAVDNGLFLGEIAVDSAGVFTLQEQATAVTVGLDFVIDVELLPPDYEDRSGSYFGEMRQLVRAVVIMKNTLSLDVGGERLLTRNVTDDLSLPPTPITGRREFLIGGDWSDEPTLRITQREPLPMEILGVILDMEI